MWLILLGVFGKFAGVITSIPDCVLGGMTIFLFANVLASGIVLTRNVDMDSRRNKFILALSLAIGVGVTVWPYAFLDRRGSPYTAAFWQCEDCSDTLKGVRNGVSIFLSTGYCVGTVVAMLLHAILPEDAEIDYGDSKAPVDPDPAEPTTGKVTADGGEDEDDVAPDEKAEKSSDEEAGAEEEVVKEEA
jgi:xanthine/uracil permease